MSQTVFLTKTMVRALRGAQVAAQPFFPRFLASKHSPGHFWTPPFREVGDGARQDIAISDSHSFATTGGFKESIEDLPGIVGAATWCRAARAWTITIEGTGIASALFVYRPSVLGDQLLFCTCALCRWRARSARYPFYTPDIVKKPIQVYVRSMQ